MSAEQPAATAATPPHASVQCAATTTTKYVPVSWEANSPVVLRQCLRWASEYVDDRPLCWWHARQERGEVAHG